MTGGSNRTDGFLSSASLSSIARCSPTGVVLGTGEGDDALIGGETAPVGENRNR